jgi:hypothetical protein
MSTDQTSEQKLYQLPSIPADYERWVERWSDQLTQALNGKGKAYGSLYGIQLEQGAQDEDIRAIIDRSASLQKKSNYQATSMKFCIADMVLELAARRDEMPRHVIEELDLQARTGYDTKTMLGWVRVARAIPHQDRHSTLSWSHFASATRFKAPDDPLEKRKFIIARAEILDVAAKDPSGHGKRWVESEMSTVQSESGVRRKKTDMRALFEYGVKLNYLDNNMSELALETIGLTLADTKNALFEFEACMINMGIIDPDRPENPGKMPVQEEFEEPGQRKIIDAEVLE